MCRVFTTHEQLAVSEEREAELAAAVQEANQSAAAAQQALAAEQETVKCLQTAAMSSEQVGPNVSPPRHTLPHDLLFCELDASAVQQSPDSDPAVIASPHLLLCCVLVTSCMQGGGELTLIHWQVFACFSAQL